LTEDTLVNLLSIDINMVVIDGRSSSFSDCFFLW